MKSNQHSAPKRIVKGLAALLAACVLGNGHAAESATKAASEGATIELSPFVVDTTADRGYSSKNTVSGTGFNQTLMKLPQTLNIMNQEMIQDLSMYDAVEALQFIAPSVSRHGFNNNDDLYVWGFRLNGQIKDGIPVNPGISSSTGPGTMYDVDRIEVIKGPAAMLYGQAAAFGGMVNYVTRKPTRVFHFHAKALFGTHDDIGGELHVSGPINDRLRYRADVGARFKHNLRKWSFDRDNFVGGGLEYDLSSYAKLELAASLFNHTWANTQTMLDPEVVRGVTVPAGVSPNTFTVKAIPLRGVPDDYSINEPWYYYKIKQGTINGTLTTTLGEKLTSKTYVAYINNYTDILRDQRGQFRTVLGGALTPRFDIANQTYSKIALKGTWSYHDLNVNQVFLKEFSTGPVHHKLTFGADQRLTTFRGGSVAYSHNGYFKYMNPVYAPFDNTAFTVLNNPPGPTAANDYLVSSTTQPGSAKRRDRTTGVYAQDAFSFMDDKITLMYGWRWNDFFSTTGPSFEGQTSPSLGQTQIVTVNGVPTIRTNAVQTVSHNSTPVYRYGGLFAPTDNYSVYYNHSESFQYNAGVDYLNNPLSPSVAENNEFGAKAQFFDGAIGVAVTYFDIKVTNVRLTFTQGPNDPFPGQYGTRQSGFQTNKGYDVSVNGNKTFDAGTLNMVAGFYQGDIRTERNVRPTRIPNTTSNIFGSFEFSRGPLKGVRIGGGTNWIGERIAPNLVTGVNNSIQTRIDPYSVSNAFAAYKWKRWTFQINVDNIADKIFITGFEDELWMHTSNGRLVRFSTGYSF